MRILTLIIIGLIQFGCLSYQELPVEYDYSYRGKFKKYKSYNFFTGEQQKEIDSLYVRPTIEKHMSFLGYRKGKRKPDILLNYTIFKDSLTFRGYDQPEMQEWIKRRPLNLDYNDLEFSLKQGTLLIQVIDRKSNTVIWQGYATDYYQKIDFTNYQQVNNAVRSILNKYQVFADGFVNQKLEQIKK